MKSKLIRILIVLCFVGMVVFGVIVFLGNHNVEQKAYLEITELKNDAKFDSLYRKASSVQSGYSGGQCPYADYTNKAIQTLNNGVDFYLYYLQDMDGMNKKDKDNLVDKYEKYVKAIEKAKSVLSKYEYYEANATSATGKQVAIHSAWFSMEYLRAFSKGYSFFVDLQEVVIDKVFNGKMFKNFAEIKVEASLAFANQSVNILVEKLDAKKGGNAISSASPQLAHISAKNFTMLNDYNKINPGQEYKDRGHATFVVNYNKISNARAFLTGPDDYIISHDKESTYATEAESFLYSAYGVVI